MSRTPRGAALLLGLAACLPSAEIGDCADLGDARVCWPDRQSPTLVKRPLPPGPPPAAGWRCQGGGAARACVDRARGGGPFTCEGDRCTQARPRLPDDGEWECVDLDGVVVCRGGAAPAGVVSGPPDPGWSCGDRRTAVAERVCVDLAPDLPRGVARGFACSFDRGQSGARTCVKKEGAPAIGAACGACPRGARCVQGRCLPLRPAPDCWVDIDCGPGGACLLGTCEGGAR